MVKPLPQLAIGNQVQLKFESDKTCKTTVTVMYQEMAPCSFPLHLKQHDTPQINHRNIQNENQGLAPTPKVNISRSDSDGGTAGVQIRTTQSKQWLCGTSLAWTSAWC